MTGLYNREGEWRVKKAYPLPFDSNQSVVGRRVLMNRDQH